MNVLAVEEPGEPSLITIGVRVQAGGEPVLERRFTVTSEDVACLVRSMRELVAGQTDRFELETLDGNAVVEGRAVGEAAAHPGHAAVGLWLGEPYRLMSGVRIMASFESMAGFCQEAEAELQQLLARTAP